MASESAYPTARISHYHQDVGGGTGYGGGTISGVWPLGVSFSALGDPLSSQAASDYGSGYTQDDAGYVWDDGENTLSIGPEFGKAFRTPGTYTVQLAVRNADRLMHTASVSVTVTDPTPDVAFHCAPTGNDTTGDGSAGNPYRTVNKCLQEVKSAWVAGNLHVVRVERGGTYTETGTTSFFFESYALLRIEPYGTGDAPVVNLTGIGNETALIHRGKEVSVRIIGIDFESDYDATAHTGARPFLLSVRASEAGDTYQHNICLVDLNCTGVSSMGGLTQSSTSPYDATNRTYLLGKGLWHDGVVATHLSVQAVHHQGAWIGIRNSSYDIARSHGLRLQSATHAALSEVSLSEPAHDGVGGACLRLNADSASSAREVDSRFITLYAVATEGRLNAGLLTINSVSGSAEDNRFRDMWILNCSGTHTGTGAQLVGGSGYCRNIYVRNCWAHSGVLNIVSWATHLSASNTAIGVWVQNNTQWLTSASDGEFVSIGGNNTSTAADADLSNWHVDGNVRYAPNVGKPFIRIYGSNQTPAGTLASCDYNTAWNSSGASANWYESPSGTFETLAQWQAAHSLDLNSSQRDPLLTSSTDMHLQSGSPEIQSMPILGGVWMDMDVHFRRTSGSADRGADESGSSLAVTFGGLGTLFSAGGAGGGSSTSRGGPRPRKAPIVMRGKVKGLAKLLRGMRLR